MTSPLERDSRLADFCDRIEDSFDVKVLASIDAEHNYCVVIPRPHDERTRQRIAATPFIRARKMTEHDTRIVTHLYEPPEAHDVISVEKRFLDPLLNEVEHDRFQCASGSRVVFTDCLVQTEFGEKLGVDVEYVYKDAVKHLSWETCHPSWDPDRELWMIDTATGSVQYAARKLEAAGYQLYLSAEAKTILGRYSIPDVLSRRTNASPVRSRREPACPRIPLSRYRVVQPVIDALNRLDTSQFDIVDVLAEIGQLDPHFLGVVLVTILAHVHEKPPEQGRDVHRHFCAGLDPAVLDLDRDLVPEGEVEHDTAVRAIRPVIGLADPRCVRVSRLHVHADARRVVMWVVTVPDGFGERPIHRIQSHHVSPRFSVEWSRRMMSVTMS